MRIAIYGAGSLGTVLGAYLTKAGLSVDLVNRNKGHIEGLKKNGARITGTVELQISVSAMLPEEMTGKYDVIFLMTKQLDNQSVTVFLKDYLTDNGVICTTQNGLPELSVAEIIGKNRTFGCAIAWGATMLGNGVVELTSNPDSLTCSIGSIGENNDEELDVLRNLLGILGQVTIEENFIGARWTKLLINSSLSGTSTVLGCSLGEAAKNRKSRFCVQQVMKECFDITEKAGIKLEPVQGKDIRKLLDYNNKLKKFLAFLIIPVAIKKHRLIRPSMLQDLENGKLCEVDAINGVVCKYGRDFHVPTPYNDLIVEIIHGIEQGKYEPGFQNISLFDRLKN